MVCRSSPTLLLVTRLNQKTHNSASQNGSPHCLLKTRPRLSKMSLSLYCREERACAISLNTKVSIVFSASVGALPNLEVLLDTKVVYRRYASLFFIAGCSSTDNELITLEIVHRYVEQMDKYYGNVCELDIIFNFQKAYFILDELLLAGEMQESSKKNVLRCISQQDSLEDMEVRVRNFLSREKKGLSFLNEWGGACAASRDCLHPFVCPLLTVFARVSGRGRGCY